MLGLEHKADAFPIIYSLNKHLLRSHHEQVSVSAAGDTVRSSGIHHALGWDQDRVGGGSTLSPCHRAENGGRGIWQPARERAGTGRTVPKQVFFFLTDRKFT